MVVAAFFMLFSTFSVPLWHGDRKYRMDTARVDFAGPILPTVAGVETATNISMGIWGYCVWADDTDHVECQSQIPYSISITDPTRNQIFIVKSSWTQGLVVHAAAAAVITVTPFLSQLGEISYVAYVSLCGFLLGVAAFTNHIILWNLVNQEIKKMESDLGAKSVLPTLPIFMAISLFYFVFGAGYYWIAYLRRRLRSTVEETGSENEELPLLSSPA